MLTVGTFWSWLVKERRPVLQISISSQLFLPAIYFSDGSIKVDKCKASNEEEMFKSGIRKAVRHAHMAHKATKWPIIKILTGPVMRPDRTKLVKYKLFCEKDFNL